MKSLCRGGCYENKHIAIKLHKHKLETLEITVAFRRNMCVFLDRAVKLIRAFQVTIFCLCSFRGSSASLFIGQTWKTTMQSFNCFTLMGTMLMQRCRMVNDAVAQSECRENYYPFEQIVLCSHEELILPRVIKNRQILHTYYAPTHIYTRLYQLWRFPVMGESHRKVKAAGL